MKQFWDLELLGIKQNEKEIYESLWENIQINNENRYEVELPFKENHPLIPDNYNECEKRLMKLLQN